VNAGKLYRNGAAVATATVKAVKGDKFVIGLTNTVVNPKTTAFIKRQPAVSSQCGSVTPTAVSLMKYTVALAQVDTVYLNYYVPTFKILSNGNIIEQVMPISAPYYSSLQAKAPNGNILWSIKDGEIASSDIQWYDYTWRDLAIDVDGGIYWPNNSKLIKVSSSGAVIWAYQNPGYQFTKAIKLRGDGVLATATNLAKPAISKISSSGSLVWKIDFSDSISDIKEGLDGSIYVTHSGSNSTQCGIGICNAITKLNSDGSFVWVKIFAVGSPGVFGTDSFLTEMAISPQGNIHVSGRGYPLGDGIPFIMSINPQGEIRWIIYPNVSPMPAIRMQWREDKLYAVLGDGYYSKSHLLKLNSAGVIESDIELDTVGYYTGPYAFDFDSAGNAIVSGHLENVGFYMRASN
jgi:hypothetical protein